MTTARDNLPPETDRIVDQAAQALRGTHVPAEPPPQVIETVLAAGHLPTNAGSSGRSLRINRIMKIAAAIVIAVTLTVGLLWLTQGPGSATIAWADVGAVVERARTIYFTMTIDKGQAMRYSARTMYMAPGLVRMETQDYVGIFDWSQGRFLTLDLKGKTAHSALVSEIKNPWSDNWFEELRKVVASPKADAVGQRQINGRMTRGWRVVSPTETATVWADVTTAEPIEVVFEAELEKVVMSNFEFDKELDESLFSFKVPDDYRLHTTTTMKESDASLEDVAGLLRIWAKGNQNTFPPHLNTDHWFQAASKADWSTEKGDFATLSSMISRAFWFLNAESGWKYVGAGVKLGDATKLIFWYKPKGSETYKVIYGDLSIKDLAEVDLPKDF